VTPIATEEVTPRCRAGVLLRVDMEMMKLKRREREDVNQ
jgi:hypothetical protein